MNMGRNAPPSVGLYIRDPLIQRVVRAYALSQGLVVHFTDSGAEAALTVSAPVRLGALLQKIRQASRQLSPAEQAMAIGGLTFDPALSVLVTPAGAEIILTEKEAGILKCLAAAQGAFVSRRDLLTQVWGYVDGVETHTLETHVYRLRQKLEEDPARPALLMTAEQGYCLKFA